MQLKRPTLKRQPAYHGRNIDSSVPPASASSDSSCPSASPCSTISPCSPATPGPFSASNSASPMLSHQSKMDESPPKSTFKLDKLPTFYYTDGNIVFGYQSPSGLPLNPGEIICKQNLTEVTHEAGAGKNYFDKHALTGVFGPLTTSVSTPTLESGGNPFFADSDAAPKAIVERCSRS